VTPSSLNHTNDDAKCIAIGEKWQFLQKESSSWWGKKRQAAAAAGRDAVRGRKDRKEETQPPSYYAKVPR